MITPSTRRLEGIDDGLHHHRARRAQRLVEHRPALRGVVDAQAVAPRARATRGVRRSDGGVL